MFLFLRTLCYFTNGADRPTPLAQETCVHDTIQRVERKEVEAITAAMIRVGLYDRLDQRSFEIELSWVLAHLPRTTSGSISWRSFELGRQLFRCLCEAQGWRCCYCGFRTNRAKSRHRLPSLEHVFPKVLGGPDHPDNFAMACVKCNSERGSRISLIDINRFRF